MTQTGAALFAFGFSRLSTEKAQIQSENFS
jgi:hypothetical protein